MQPLRIKDARVSIALLVLGLCVAWLAWTGAGERAEAIEAAPKRANTSSPAEASVELSPLETTEPVSVDARPESAAALVESARKPVVWEPSPIRKSAIGRLVVRAVDATTNEPLRSFGVRLASDTRFAAERSQTVLDGLELPLTADTYSIVVFSPGYESVELSRVKVTAGQKSRLEPASLRPGVGRILVDVRGAASYGRSLCVELIGVGRRPCERCSDTDDSKTASDARARAWERSTPCLSCGFAREHSRLPLAASPNVQFAGLASGNYALRVIDDHGRTVCEAQELALRDGEYARVAFDLSSQRYVELEFFDTDGRSLTEEWRSRLSDTRDDVAELVSMESAYPVQSITLEFSDDSKNSIASASFVPPLPRGSGAVSIGIGGGGSFSGKRLGTRKTFDRERWSDDTLWPTPAAARFRFSTVACDIEDNGVARVGPLPSSRLELHATVEHFIADAIVPASRATERIPVKLRTASLDPTATPEFETYSAYEMAGWK